MTALWDIALCKAIALMIEAACASETSVYLNEAISHVHTRRRENLKYIVLF
jgi:hypothetical protein